MAPAVRWPKSASKIAASASRRPVRRPRWRSASDTIDDDALPDGGFRSAHVATSWLGIASRSEAGSSAARAACSCARASAMSSGTRVRAVVAATSHA